LAKAPRKTGSGLTSFVDFASRSVHLDEQNRLDLSNHDIHEPGLNDIHDPVRERQPQRESHHKADDLKSPSLAYEIIRRLRSGTAMLQRGGLRPEPENAR
jgi:hypothetical protein